VTRRILVVFSHPVATSLAAAARDRVLAAAEVCGHEVKLIDLYAEGFDPVLEHDQWRQHIGPSTQRPDLEHHVAALRWADTLVFVYPTWFGCQPAMLKGWFDRVFSDGVAFDFVPGRRRPLKAKLRNIRRIVVVTTHGSGKFLNSLQGEPGKRVILRTVRLLCHPLARSRWVALYEVDRAGNAPRVEFLDRVEQAVGRL
jgi:putative NADPH-quinone reductase